MDEVVASEAGTDQGAPGLAVMSRAECLAHLAGVVIGRLGLVVDGRPVVLPVNVHVIRSGEDLHVVLRTRPGGLVDSAAGVVALEVDGVDVGGRTGWSVLLQGEPRPVDPCAEPEVLALDPVLWVRTPRLADARARHGHESSPGRRGLTWSSEARNYL